MSKQGPWNIDYDVLCHFKNQAAVKDVDPVYRLISGASPSLRDFKPYCTDLNKKQSCKCYGISVWESINDLNDLIMKMPSKKNKKIAEGRIGKNDGKVLGRVSDSHITWWITMNDPHKQFKVMP